MTEVSTIWQQIFDEIFETKYLTLTKVSIDVAARLLEMFSIFILFVQRRSFKRPGEWTLSFIFCRIFFNAWMLPRFRSSEYDLINMQLYLSSAGRFSFSFVDDKCCQIFSKKQKSSIRARQRPTVWVEI